MGQQRAKKVSGENEPSCPVSHPLFPPPSFSACFPGLLRHDKGPRRSMLSCPPTRKRCARLTMRFPRIQCGQVSDQPDRGTAHQYRLCRVTGRGRPSSIVLAALVHCKSPPMKAHRQVARYDFPQMLPPVPTGRIQFSRVKNCFETQRRLSRAPVSLVRKLGDPLLQDIQAAYHLKPLKAHPHQTNACGDRNLKPGPAPSRS